MLNYLNVKFDFVASGFDDPNTFAVLDPKGFIFTGAPFSEDEDEANTFGLANGESVVSLTVAKIFALCTSSTGFSFFFSLVVLGGVKKLLAGGLGFSGAFFWGMEKADTCGDSFTSGLSGSLDVTEDDSAAILLTVLRAARTAS